VTFDSYSHITLELPQESTVSLEVTIRFADSSLRPQRILIKVKSSFSREGASLGVPGVWDFLVCEDSCCCEFFCQ
jgi:hypothetical protein